MEKKLEAQLDNESMTAVTVKEYAPSEAFSAEPPPAYQRPKSTVVQVARIAAVTVVLTSFILGGFIFAAAWVQANSACQDALNEQLARMDQMLEDRAVLGPQYQALVGEPQGDASDSDQQPQSASQHAKREEPRRDREEQDADKDRDDKDDDQQENAVDPPIHLKLPLQLDFDELAGALMERNQRSRMNCVVEKRRAEEVVDHQPRTVRLPFGLNLTTDPRYEHVSGERMAIFCESGNDQRHVPMEQMQPIVVPIQQAPMQPTHQQLQQQMQQQHQQQMQMELQQQIQMHLQQQMQRQQEDQMRRQEQMHRQEQMQRQQQQFGPPPPQQQQMPIQVLPMSQAEARGFQQHQTPLVTMHALHAPQHVPLAAAHGFEHDGHPPRQGRHFVSLPEGPVAPAGPAPSPRGRGFQGQGVPLELRGVPVQAAMTVEVEGRDGPIEVEGRSLTPQQLQHLEQLHQLQQMQPQDGSGPQILPIEVIDARAFQHPQQDMQQGPQPQGPGAPMPADTLRPPYQRTPIHAVPPQEEEPRPHYVQPRSVRSSRSVDALLHREKRVRRCACDCNC